MVSADWQQAVLTPLPYAGEDMDFSAKYANVPPEMLVPAYQLLTKHMTSVGQDILKERLKSGRYEEKFVQEGGSPEEVRGSADGKPLTVGFSTEHVSGGGSRVKKVEFSKEEYPEFRSIQLEYAWLHNHLHSLQLCKCGG
jgi:hypothetical protein